MKKITMSNSFSFVFVCNYTYTLPERYISQKLLLPLYMRNDWDVAGYLHLSRLNIRALLTAHHNIVTAAGFLVLSWGSDVWSVHVLYALQLPPTVLRHACRVISDIKVVVDMKHRKCLKFREYSAAWTFCKNVTSILGGFEHYICIITSIIRECSDTKKQPMCI